MKTTCKDIMAVAIEELSEISHISARKVNNLTYTMYIYLFVGNVMRVRMFHNQKSYRNYCKPGYEI